MALLLVDNLFIATCYKVLLLAVGIDFSINHLSLPLLQCLITICGDGISFLVCYVYSISHWYGPAGFCSVRPFQVLLLSPLTLLLPLGSLGSTLKSRVYSAKQKCVTICCSKWSYAVTQMSQTEMRWCMVSAVQASGEGVMVFRPYSWYTVGLLMATVQCRNARAHLYIAARFSYSLQSCTANEMIGTLRKIMLPGHGDRILYEFMVRDTFRWNDFNNLDTAVSWCRSPLDSLKCSICRREHLCINLL